MINAAKMEEMKVHIQHVVLWEFTNSKNTTEIAKKTCKDKVSLLTAKSETGFQSFNILLKDEPKSGCSLDLNQDALR